MYVPEEGTSGQGAEDERRKKTEEKRGNEEEADERRTTKRGRREDSPVKREKTTRKPQVPKKSVSGWVVCVTGLGKEHSEGRMRELLSAFGEVNRVMVTKAHATGQPLVCLAEFDVASEAEAAMVAMGTFGLQAGFAFMEDDD